MLVIKNAGFDGRSGGVLLLMLLLVAGCTPAGPRALLDGERLIEQGRLDQAVERLETATRLLPSNAQAWNHLGLALHGVKRSEEAVLAYQRALALDKNLAAGHFNLGCLYLETGNYDGARAELTAFTLSRERSLEGWLKLASAQLRSRKFGDAERSYARALGLDKENAEAWNGLGLVQLTQGRVKDAGAYFEAALRYDPDCPAALLNRAIYQQQYTRNRPAALQAYREYLSLTPRPANWADVRQVAMSLEATEQGVRNSAGEPFINPPAVTNGIAAPAATRKAVAVTPKTESRPPTPIPSRVETEPVSAPASNASPPVRETNDNKPEPTPVPVTPAPFEVVKVEQPGAIQPAQDVRSGATRLDGRTENDSPYVSQIHGIPQSGNRVEAEKLFTRAVRAHRSGRLGEAIALYHSAAKADPAYFEVHYNLGLAAYERGDLRESERAYETALALNPDSAQARYNFALALKRAGHLSDAAVQLEKLLLGDPLDLKARLTLAHLYARQLNRPSLARMHYRKLLQLAPAHPESTEMRYWLKTHP